MYYIVTNFLGVLLAVDRANHQDSCSQRQVVSSAKQQLVLQSSPLSNMYVGLQGSSELWLQQVDAKLHFCHADAV